MSRIRKDTEAPVTPEKIHDGTLPAYKPFPERTRRRAKPDEQCTEIGCTKTVAQHIAEFKEAFRHIEAREIRL